MTKHLLQHNTSARRGVFLFLGMVLGELDRSVEATGEWKERYIKRTRHDMAQKEGGDFSCCGLKNGLRYGFSW